MSAVNHVNRVNRVNDVKNTKPRRLRRRFGCPSAYGGVSAVRPPSAAVGGYVACGGGFF
jgi:hypothetical protein